MTDEQRRQRAAEMAARCAGEHRVRDHIYYCTLPMGHKGDHYDIAGRHWRGLFPWLRKPKPLKERKKDAAAV